MYNAVSQFQQLCNSILSRHTTLIARIFLLGGGVCVATKVRYFVLKGTNCRTLCRSFIIICHIHTDTFCKTNVSFLCCLQHLECSISVFCYRSVCVNNQWYSVNYLQFWHVFYNKTLHTPFLCSRISVTLRPLTFRIFCNVSCFF